MPRFTVVLPFILAAALIAPRSAAADSGATCTLSFRVHFEPSGRIVQDGGSGNCIGSIAGALLDPEVQPAVLSGQAHSGVTSCFPRLVAGALTLPVRRLIDFSPNPDDELSALWTGSTYVGGLPVLSGRGDAMGQTVRLTGAIRFISAGRCTARGFTPGTIQMEAIVDESANRHTARRR